MDEHTARLLERLNRTWQDYQNGDASEETPIGMISATGGAMDGSVPADLRRALRKCEREVELAYTLLSTGERKQEISKSMREVLAWLDTASGTETVTTLPEHFHACRIEAKLASFGTIGTVVGTLFHFPCWVGILEPTSALGEWQETIQDLLDEDDLIIQLHDLDSEETWSGSLSHLMLPRPDYPWHELTWRDDRKPTKDKPSSLLGKLGQKLGDILYYFLTNRDG
jgi:hypothetical protein